MADRFARVLRRSSPCLLALGLGGCRTFFPPTPELVANLDARAADQTGDLRATGRVRVESDVLRGEFLAAVAWSRGDRPRIRVQWFPELGGKVLDLLATPERIAGALPATDQRLDIHPDAPAAAYQPLLLMGLSVLESCLLVTPERVLDARPLDQGFELRLRSVRRWLRLRAKVDDQGNVRQLDFDHLGARWSERRDADGRRRVIEAKGFRIEILIEEIEPEATLPDAVFEWQSPDQDPDS
jgi:hypothetical protein